MVFLLASDCLARLLAFQQLAQPLKRSLYVALRLILARCSQRRAVDAHRSCSATIGRPVKVPPRTDRAGSSCHLAPAPAPDPPARDPPAIRARSDATCALPSIFQGMSPQAALADQLHLHPKPRAPPPQSPPRAQRAHARAPSPDECCPSCARTRGNRQAESQARNRLVSRPEADITRLRPGL